MLFVDLVKYRAYFQGASKRLIQGGFWADRRYLDVLGDLVSRLSNGLFGVSYG